MKPLRLLVGSLALLLLGAGWTWASEKRSSQIVITEEQAGKVVVTPPKPQVWFLLPCAQLNFRSASDNLELAQKISDAVNKTPF